MANEQFRPSKSLPALGYTQELGRRLENIRHYEPVTNLVPRGASVLDRRRGGGVLASPVTGDDYSGYFKVIHHIKYKNDKDEVGHNYIYVVDGNSFNINTLQESNYTNAGNDQLCSITYPGYAFHEGWQSKDSQTYTKKHKVEPRQFNAEEWDEGIWYIYLIFPFNTLPYLLATQELRSNVANTDFVYLIGVVKKEISKEDGRQKYDVIQQHTAGEANVYSNQYTGMFKLVPTVLDLTLPDSEEQNEQVALAICEGQSWNGATGGTSACEIFYVLGGFRNKYNIECIFFTTDLMGEGAHRVVLMFPYRKEAYIDVIPLSQPIVIDGVYYDLGVIYVDKKGHITHIIQLHIRNRAYVEDGQYMGMFKIVDGSYMTEQEREEGNIKIIDGTGSLSQGFCGVFVSGVDQVNVPIATLSASHGGFVVMEATYNHDDGGTSGNWEINFDITPRMPEFTDKKFVAIIGRIGLSDGKVSALQQIWFGGVMYNNRYS